MQPIRKSDIRDADIVDAYELASDGQVATPESIYLTTTGVSTTSSSQTIVSNLPTDGEGLMTSADHPVQAGDFVVITGSSPGGIADGQYTVASVVTDTSVTVVQAIPNSTGGTLQWVYPSGASQVGYDDTGNYHITHTDVQDALTDLDKAIPIYGTAIVNFGAFPGASDATVTVTGLTGISASSVVQAWIFPVATADHSVDEHRVDEIQADADTIVPGVGFTIFARTRNDCLYGEWTVGWSCRL